MYCVRNILYYICIVILFISCSIEEEGLVKRAPSPDAPSSQLAITSSRNASNTYTEAFGIFVCQSGTIYKDFDNEQFTVSKIVQNEIKEIDTLYLASTEDKKILYPANKEEKIDFYGYYPYKSDITLANPYYIIKNWAADGVDLLIAKELDKNSTSPKVNLTFKHMFSKIVINIVADSENTTLTNQELIDMKAEVSNMNVVTQCDVTAGTPEIVYRDGKPIRVNEPMSFTVQSKEDNSQRAECIVCPEYNPKDENGNSLVREVTFTLPNYGNKTYTWSIPSVIKGDTGNFEKGKSYVWNLRLKGDDLITAEFVGIFNDWEIINHTEDIILK